MAGSDFLAVTGATATGKTALSLRLAGVLDGEIISMDSRQVYRGMDVATDKVSLADRARARHHGLDILDPGSRYSAGAFGRDARRWMREIRGRRRVPILAGGTGFFLRSLIRPIFREPPMDPDTVDRLRRLLGSWDTEKLAAWVRVLDPARFEVARQGGRNRLVRTLEVPLLTGRPLSWWHRAAPADAEPLRGLIVVLELPREELYRRIEERVGRMVGRGLVSEVRRFVAAGYGADDPGMTGTGYREVALHLAGEISLSEALERMKRATRAYARRQLTWFRNQLPDDTVRLDATALPEEQERRVVEMWRSVCREAPSTVTGGVDGGRAPGGGETAASRGGNS